MNQNQSKSKSKSKVEERKSVANQCDYSRMNGKCGRALCDNFGKPCPGRSCEDWKCDAEGTAVTAVSTAQPLNRLTAKPLNFTDQDVAAGIKRQCKVIEDAEKNAQLERAKLGVILIRWEQYLGECRGGRGKAGEGLKGWLAKNVPELNYKTAINYKAQAEQALNMLGGGAKAQAVLLDEPTVTQPDGEVIEVEAEYVAKRDKIFEDVKSRRQLEQTYFKFMASEGKGKPGRPKGTGAGPVEYKKKSSLECAVEAVWPTVQHLLKHRGEMFTAYKILPDEKLTEFRDTLTEHVKAIEAVLAGREN